MENFELFKKNINKKKIAVLGLGISNKPLVKLLVKCGSYVTIFDEKIKSKWIHNNFIKSKIRFVVGENSFSKLEDEQYQYIFRSPGIRRDLNVISSLEKLGSIVTSEMEIFFKYCKAPIFGITGSNGKSTTTTLIYEILKNYGYKCRIGGNIGNPLLYDIENIMPNEKIIVELSSFQLQSFTKSPDVAVITNVSPNHLNWHKDYEEYIKCKENIFVHQNKNNLLILNYDNEITRDFSKKHKGKILFFSLNNDLETGIVLNDDSICHKEKGKYKKIINIHDILIKGKHNIENYMAAIAAVMSLVEMENIETITKNFRGLPHRAEFIKNIQGVSYYNSSIDSSPERTIATLNVFKKKVVLICGGQSKGNSYDELGRVIAEKVKKLILIGDTADLIEKSLKNYLFDNKIVTSPEIFRCSSYVEIVKIAKKISHTEDIVILSPASTSFDMFQNFEERGNLFKRLIQEISY
ncbi:MAG: UDP-N-acetylmuramoyl-L-alanine--D-glutamate ligase [Clostridiales bacterium]|jgi:UDP-N-acetylmuramoylalanine--D-glutamate ligase|nr:UDP-N-acetylmuramoyl-L-alanine--D-glutamate ligase [Clostridiales bacterium]